MSKYYLVHSVVDPQNDKILKILSDGYLYSSTYSEQQGISGVPLQYVYFTLLGDNISFHGGVNFIISTDILFERSFRYALSWIGSHINETTKVNYKFNDVNKVLDKINLYIDNIKKMDPDHSIMSHEILLKKKINLHRYLVAICCRKKLSSDIIIFIKNHYPNVKILDTFPKSANELNNMINKDNNYKYKKYKTKYLNLKKNLKYGDNNFKNNATNPYWN